MRDPDRSAAIKRRLQQREAMHGPKMGGRETSTSRIAAGKPAIPPRRMKIEKNPNRKLKMHKINRGSPSNADIAKKLSGAVRRRLMGL